MPEFIRLYGYQYSVYNWIARFTLLSKQVEYQTIEINPFNDLSEEYLRLHPFGRVPVLSHGSFKLFETSAITRYVDRAFTGRPLQPTDADALARMDQVISVIDNYAYWPMVRQVFSHAFFRPQIGEEASLEEIGSGLEAAGKVLAFLEDVATESRILTGDRITLADCHLAPMISYFVKADEGKAVLLSHNALQNWWDRISAMDDLLSTDPMSAYA